MARRILLGLFILVAVGIVAYAVLAWRPAIDPIQPPDATAFDPELVARGAVLARIGNCIDCHTAPAGGRPYAGGYPVESPYGTVWGTNITPDPETGIGRWSEAAFIRSMREGLDREGRHLFPAFPYDQFTRTTDEDLRALYAYFMTREPVRAEAPAPDLPPPLGFRPLLAGWKLLYLDVGPFRPDLGQDEVWNHGAYLVDGLAHCGACHTPRNMLGAREEDRALSGGESEDWHAPALNAMSPSPRPWTLESLTIYLRTGLHEEHAIAAGPMAPVVRNLAQVPEDEVAAMATYIAWHMGAPEGREEPADTAEPQPAQAPVSGGATEALYAGACGICHEAAAPLQYSARVPLSLATSIEYPDPRNLIRVILEGIEAPDATRVPVMPGFAGALTDEQVTALAVHLRTRFSEQLVWDDLDEEVSRIREELEDERR